MELFRWESKKHGTVVLTGERWNHIQQKHTEMRGRIERIRRAVENPDIIQKSRKDADSWLYYKRVEDGYTAVVVQALSGFITTAYLVSEPKQGDVRWRR